MILDEFYGSVIFEEEVPPDQVPPDMQGEVPPQEPPEPPEFMPLRKYYLLQKLFDLRNKLDTVNINNDTLDTILKFAPDFSYDTLVVLTDKIADSLKSELQGAMKNAKK